MRNVFSSKNPNENFEFKITRGSWKNVATDQLGNEIENRVFEPGIEDTIRIKVKGWKDLTN